MDHISQQNKLKLLSGAFYIPKGKKAKPQGEDAHFICPEKQTFGVADGVGSWSKHGVDAGIYARELMENCFVSVLLFPSDSSVDPKKVLVEGHSNTKVAGSSTACIITLQGNQLHAVNLGDSGFAVLRDGNIVHRSVVQQHGFNYPYQLSNGHNSDSPLEAMEFKVDIQVGDIIVAGTDGLFDNMFDHQLEEIIKMQQTSHPETMAWSIAEHASYNSADRYSETPFSLASKVAGEGRDGGKADDITVIVAIVQTHDE